MSNFFNNIFGRQTNQSGSTEAILRFHENLQMLEKKQSYLEKQIEEQTALAKKHANSNKRLALTALRRKKAYESEIEKLFGIIATLEEQKAALENANLNAELYKSMKEGSNALKELHKSMKAEQVDKIMDQVRENQAIQEDITALISTPIAGSVGLDDEELLAELEEIRQDELDNKMLGIDQPPIKVPQHQTSNITDDELEEEVKKLQAELAS